MTEANVKVNGISVVLALNNNDAQVEKNKITIYYLTIKDEENTF